MRTFRHCWKKCNLAQPFWKTIKQCALNLNKFCIPSICTIKTPFCPGQVAQLLTASPQHTKVVSLIPGQGTYKIQPPNA